MDYAANTVEKGFLFKGQKINAKKSFGTGGWREKSASETLAEIRPLFAPAGITRLADITGLDRIGIPVTLAIRPNSRTLAVSSGKGTDLESALVSGAMEALELYHAEFSTPESFLATYDEVSRDGLSIPVELLPLRTGSLFNSRWPETWVHGWDIINEKKVAVPIQAVIMASQAPKGTPPSIASFVTDSNGLASGNNLIEAIISALYEVIERDAVALHRIASEHSGDLLNKIAINSLPFTSVQDIYNKIKRANCDILLYDCTTNLGIPSYRAVLLDFRSECASIVEGFGTNLSHEVALVRAMTEACQGRVVVISGARDDIYNFSMERLKANDLTRHFPGLLDQPSSPFQNPTACIENDDLGMDLRAVLTALTENGIRQVIVVRLELFDCKQSFVKVLVPGLEGYPTHGYIPGSRALATQTRFLSEGSRAHLEPAIFTALHLPAGGAPR